MTYGLSPGLLLLSEKNWPKSPTLDAISATYCHILKYVSMKLNYFKFMFEITSPWSSRNQKSSTVDSQITPFQYNTNKKKNQFLSGHYLGGVCKLILGSIML